MGGLCYRHRKKKSKDNNSTVVTSKVPNKKVAASQPDLTPILVPSLCMSSNAISEYNKDTDDEDEGSRNYKTEEHPIKKEYDEAAYELDTDDDDESGVEKVPV